MLRFPPFLRPPLLLLPFLLSLPFQPPVRLFLIRVAVVLLPLFFPTPFLSSRGILDLLSPIVFQFTFLQLTIFPANQPPKYCELGTAVEPFEGSRLLRQTAAESPKDMVNSYSGWNRPQEDARPTGSQEVEGLPPGGKGYSSVVGCLLSTQKTLGPSPIPEK